MTNHAITGSDLKFLNDIGFKDTNDDGVFTREEQPEYAKGIDGFKLATVFTNLSRAFNEGTEQPHLTFIDARDMLALRSNKKVLAAVIENDPVYDVMTRNENKGWLSFEKKEHMGLIMPRDYRRMMFYVQLAYKKIFPNEAFDPNGIYGPTSAKCTLRFQQTAGIDSTGDRAEGKLVDRTIMAAIIARLKVDGEFLSQTVARLEKYLQGQPNGEVYSFSQITDKALLRDTFLVLQYLFPNDVRPFRVSSHAMSADPLEQAEKKIVEIHGGPRMGPKFVQTLKAIIGTRLSK
ncbi:MAG: hypothetical protein HQM16_13430 [Deltaproteobacteria bacterium]|nr:hypothetical protein [Deltaproteobacteria bacterium]